MAAFSASSLAVPAIVILIIFLGYTSQFLYPHLDPHPLEQHQEIKLNVLLACLLISFARGCWTDPGRVPKDWVPEPVRVHGDDTPVKAKDEDAPTVRPRWCSRCDAPKPPRTHHCKTCERCIPKMDHHCPWLANCVSHTTYPHFWRTLVYATLALGYNEYLLYIRCAEIWNKRHLPSYLGPTAPELMHLFVLMAVNSATTFGVSIMTLRFGQMFGQNVTTIESWEIERHDTLVNRARYLGGQLDRPDGTRVRIKKQEFPYDIGIFANMAQAMGTKNILAWFWPFAATPPNDTGLNFEVNGFEDLSVTWPPPDPDRVPLPKRQFKPEDAFTHTVPDFDDQQAMADFKKRQAEDLKRWQSTGLQRRRPFHERVGKNVVVEREGSFDSDEESLSEGGGGGSGDESGEEAWKNSEGERLRDFGVDEEAEFYDEDEVPLSELMRRKKAAAAAATAQGT
ncbi:dhhc zinc finger membrane protein [Diplodia corticola]|uniref:Palmitoyltransferase PFA4 n=1 Tax=Diplodia corticola TaxID=236234 RepID=A0A1J9RMU6_9PEZI|nr:dhhc zinc finger membrane protein [Diplodia corticola]OJD29839.1 dhhc zinc finger membrane protein [Diplodia corticola]